MQVYESQVYDEFVIRGNTAVMRCHIPSFVADYVAVTKWIVDGSSHIQSPAESGNRYSILATGELYIRDVGVSDGNRHYRCLTTHRLTGEVKHSATAGRLFVTDPQGSVPPRITGSKASVYLERGKMVVVPCAAQGYPIPSYSWLKKMGKSQIVPIDDTERVQVIGGMLLIRDAQNGDAAVYVCVVNNSVGVERIETSVVVTAALDVIIEPRVQTADIGKAAVMKCVISGFPVSSVSWLKDGQPLPSDRVRVERVDLLRIVSVQKGDAGMYQCLVRNEAESAQGTAELRLGDSVPELRQTFQDMVMHPGSAVSLMCIASGIPPSLVTWALDGSIIAPSRRTKTSSYITADGDVVSHLNLTSTRSEDGGDYSCIAQNRVGSTRHTSRLNIYENHMRFVQVLLINVRAYIRPMRKMSIVAGDRLMLKCPVAGYPIASIFWEKEGTVLPVDFRQEVFANGTLIVQNVQRTADTGKYTCSVSSPDGQTARRDVEVSVMGKFNAEINFTSVIFLNRDFNSSSRKRSHVRGQCCIAQDRPFSFQDAVLPEGTRARLQCVVSEGDVPLSIRWTKDSHQIPADLGVVIRDLDEISSILTINNVTPRQNGRYTCTVSNEAASVNHSAVLHVNVPPQWVVQPQDADVLVGHSVRLDCQADGFPKPIITWMKVGGGGARQSIQNSVHYQVLTNGSLRLMSADENDRGQYFCLASNGIGAGLSKRVHLKVKVPVKFDVKYRHQTIKRGADAALICQVRGDSPVQLTWQVNERDIDAKTERRYDVKETLLKNGLISELRIRHVEREDTATFSCSAKNAYGRDDTSIQLLILENPDMPKMVKLMEHKSRSIKLSWTQPYDGNSPIINYLVQYKLIEEDWEESVTNVTVMGLESVTTIGSLLPAHDYHFRVFAENEVGLSDPSDVLQVTTSEEVPSGPPQDVKVQATGATSLLVTWKNGKGNFINRCSFMIEQPPKRGSWNGELLGYNVGFRQHDAHDSFTFRTVELAIDPDQEMALELTGLRKFAKYGVVVRAFNRVGHGTNSDEVVEQTAEDVPALPPENLECVPLSSQSLQVSWQPVPSYAVHGLLQGFKVIYKPTEEWYDGVEAETKITSALKTIIHGLERFSNYSIQVLAFTRRGDGTLSSPVYCNTLEDDIIKYSVYMRSVDPGKEETFKQVVSGSQTHHKFIALKENQRYEFWVTASTSVGEGQSTHVVSVQLAGPPVAAKIAEFDTQMVTSLGSDVSLSCWAIGIPLPDREWRSRGQSIEKNERIQWLPDGTLTITDVRSYDIGNYTCHIWNSHGSDDVTYTILVQVPPAPPYLTVSEVSSDAIVLKWVPDKAEGMLILGFTIHFKREYGEWEEIFVGADHLTYTLFNLECGTRYQMYVTARNKIGVGDASQILTARTKGAAPTVPTREKLIEESATYVTLHLSSWYEATACPILYFVVHHKPRDENIWTLVSNNVQPHQNQFVIPDLQPATWYRLRITAHNSAGSSVAEYDFATLTVTGVTLASEPAINDAPENEPRTWDMKMVASVSGSAVVVVTVIALVCFFGYHYGVIHHKETVRDEHFEKPLAEPTTKSYTTKNSNSGSFTYLLTNNDRTRTHLISEANVEGVHDDACPYATFQLSENKQNSNNTAEELRTFSKRHPSDVEEIYSKVRKANSTQRSRTPYAYPDSQAYANPEQKTHDTSTLASDSTLQLHPRHQCRPGQCDHHVPDLLEHGPESGSSNEPSPNLEKAAPFMSLNRGRASALTPMRQTRSNNRYAHQPQTTETTLIFQDGLEVYLPYYEDHNAYTNVDRSYE
uniref:Down syndrome cell adhesion molecule-like protein Dscam2 n=1 Tax=Strigamia maritima TaxID=126957 RepID=T1J836_STRMM